MESTDLPHDTFDLLDHGYLKYVENWGSDERLVEAARMSTRKGFRSWEPYLECQWCKCWVFTDDPVLKTEVSCLDSEDGKHDWKDVKRGDFGLLDYLYSNRHATPFEMAGMTIVVQAPIFVFREWHRHRTQSYNELSSRYEPLPDLNYVPSLGRLMTSVGGKNKQAGTIKGARDLTEGGAQSFRADLITMYDQQERLYRDALSIGIPKELARVHLPVGRYSRMMASGNLRNWLAFLTLRMDVKAQWEIRQYANKVGEFISNLYPRTWELFQTRVWELKKI